MLHSFGVTVGMKDCFELRHSWRMLSHEECFWMEMCTCLLMLFMADMCILLWTILILPKTPWMVSIRCMPQQWQYTNSANPPMWPVLWKSTVLQKTALPVEKTRKEKWWMWRWWGQWRHILTSFINVTLFGWHVDASSVFWLLLVHKCKCDCH